MRKQTLNRFTIAMVCASLLFSACGAKIVTPEPTATTMPTLTPTPIPTDTPTPVPTATPVTPTAEPDLRVLRIAYVKGDIGETDIYVADADGSNPVCVACDAACDEAEPTWSPDGTQLIYQSDCGDSYDLWIVNVDGSNPKQLMDTANVDEREPDWSPTGNQIVYRASDVGAASNTNGTLTVMNAGGGDAESFNAEGRTPKWSPDGNSIAYMSESNNDWEIYIYDVVNGSSSALSSCTHSCRWPDWSPAGDALIFHDTTAVGSVLPNSIWTSSITEWSPTYVLDGASASRAVWSSTGIIAFNSNNGIETAKPDGSERAVLIEGAENWAPVWSH